MQYSLQDDGSISFGELNILLDAPGNFEKYRQNDDVLYMAKSQGYLDSYAKIADFVAAQPGSPPIRNLMEIGIFRGGSAAFFDRFFEPEKMVCVDFTPIEVKPLTSYIARHARGAIHPFYGINQADGPAITRIIEAEFSGPIDIVVDDASHFYAETKASFETVFPYVRPGGVYVIEDWGWAHDPHSQRPEHPWHDRLSPTTLVFELLAAHATDTRFIRNIGFATGLMWVERGPAPLPKGGLARLIHGNY